MKILLTRPFFEADINYLRDRLPDQVELVIPDSFEEENMLKHAAEADVFYGPKFTDRMLRAADKLQLIQIPWTGVDHLDFELLRQFSVPVCNSHSNARVVAEHAVALMLDITKKISYHDRQMRQGKWNRPVAGQEATVSPFSMLLTGSTIAIVGYGAIGNNIHQLLSGFSCRFHLVRRQWKETLEMNDVDQFTDVLKAVTGCSAVFVTLPLTDQTRGLIDKAFLHAMGPDSVLVNVSRGELVEEDALFDALKKNTIAGAAIDTWFRYPDHANPVVTPSADHSFEELDNLVMSPHRAGFMQGGFPHLDDAIENVIRLSEGEPLINRIDLEARY